MTKAVKESKDEYKVENVFFVPLKRVGLICNP